MTEKVALPKPQPGGKGKAAEDGSKQNSDKKNKKNDPEDEMSEEDLKKKEEIDAAVQKTLEGESVNTQLAFLTSELQAATTSMTSVPKPLKFLRPHFSSLEEKYQKMDAETADAKNLCDILSVLATTYSSKETVLALKYRFLGNKDTLLSWGVEYLRNIAREMAAEFQQRQEQSSDCTELNELTEVVVPHLLKTGSLIEALDLLNEMGERHRITDYLMQHLDMSDKDGIARVARYLLSMSAFLPDDEPAALCRSVYDLFLRSEQYVDALRVALKLDDETKVIEIFTKAKEETATCQQMAFLLCRQRRFCHIFDETEGEANALQDGKLRTIASGELQAPHYQLLAKELDVLEPKTPEDIYKTHLEERRNAAATAFDSAKQNLANTIVNAFVNAGFSKDTLMTDEGAASSQDGENKESSQGGGGAPWLYRNKDRGMMAAVASLGALHLWNPDSCLGDVDKYTYSDKGVIKAGAWMAIGLSSTGVRTEVDVAKGLLSEPLDSDNALDRLGAVLGLGYAYAGTSCEDMKELLTPCLLDTSLGVEVSAMAALSLGLIFVGSEDADLVETLLTGMMDQAVREGAMSSPAIFTAVAVGLLFLQKGESAKLDTTIELLDALESPLGRYASLCCKSCAYATSGNVLQVQKMVQMCAAQHCETENDADAMIGSLAVIGIPLIAMGEEVGAEMVQRMLDHLLQYGDVYQRRAIPVAMALLYASDPKPSVVDTLSKLSHDADADVALHAILALGLVGLGTNNSRIAGLLRQLAAFYTRDANALFVVRLAQGLLYAGKGLLTASPLHSDWLLSNPVSLASLLVVLHGMLHTKNTILEKLPYIMFHLFPALHPRMLITVDEQLEHLPVTVRVGQALDVVGQAGKPKAITGFQTHSSPVVLSYTHRAELASEDYIARSPVLEGVVLLSKNPDAEQNKDLKKA